MRKVVRNEPQASLVGQGKRDGLLEPQASLVGQGKRDELPALRRKVDAQSGLSASWSTPREKWECVASAVSVASPATYLLVSAAAPFVARFVSSAAAPVAASFVSSPALLAYSAAFPAGFHVPCDDPAPALSCASCCSPLFAAVDLKLMQ